MSRTFCLVFLFFLNDLCGNMTKEEIRAQGPQIRARMREMSNPKIYLLSYPNSGNTWLRYCIEVLTQRPTAETWNTNHFVWLPLGLFLGHDLDFNKAPVWKAHTQQVLGLPDANNRHVFNKYTDKLIFIVRNYKEVLQRTHGSDDLMAVISGKQREQVPDHQTIHSYFNILRCFDNWPAQNKLLIYYEDVLSDPENILKQIITFLGDDIGTLDSFLPCYEQHKKIGLSTYDQYCGGSQTHGESTLYHSKALSQNQRHAIDRWVSRRYACLWKKYLKARYAEDVLVYT